MTTVDKDWCRRADVTGYDVAQGQAYVDCKLARTGTDGLYSPPIVMLIAIPLLVFGALMRRAARKGRL